MTAPTIKTKVTADTSNFDKNMGKVSTDIKSTSNQIKKFGSTVRASGDKPLKSFAQSIKKAGAQLKPFATGIKNVTTSLAKWGAAGVAAAGVAGAAIVTTSLNSIKELRNLAQMSDISAAALQRGAFAARTVGVDMEQYAQALKDVNDRIGDFNATGAGPMVDFFEQIAPKVGITAAAFEGLNSEQSLALYIKSLEDANVSQAEMTFFMEAIAGDATKLIPLFANNAKQMKALKKEAQELGIGLSEIDVKQAMAAQTELSKIVAIVKNELTVAVVEVAPIITAIGKQMVSWFKQTVKEGGGVATVMGDFAVGVVSYLTEISRVFAYVGKAFDIVKASFGLFVNVMQNATGAAMRIVSNFVITPLKEIITMIQFTSNAFNEGFGSGLLKTFQRFRLMITSYLIKPVGSFLEVLAKIPDEFGGDIFKDALAGVKRFRDEVEFEKNQLDEQVISPNVDVDTPLGKFNDMFGKVNNFFDVAEQKSLSMSDSLLGGTLDSIVAIGDALTQSIEVDGVKNALKKAIDSVKAEQLNGDQEGVKGSTDITGVGAEKSEDGETISPVQLFFAETEKLLEAQLSRYMSQNELTLQQYQNEMQMLNDQLSRKEISEAEHGKRMNDLKKKESEINKKISKDNMMSGLSILTQGSGKASKIMKKFAIAQALIKGKQAAVDAWQAGMSTGGPFAPVVAAAYTAASIARTGSMISAIRGGGSSSGGGGASPSVNTGQSSAPASQTTNTPQQQPSRVFNVEFTGESNTGVQQTRDLLELINEQAGDNVMINVGGI